METQDGLMDPPHGSLRNQSKPLLQEPHPHSSSSSGQQGPGSVGVASIDGGDFRGGGHKSRSSSLTSVEENGATETEHPPPSAARRNKTALPQDRIVSPETDSGFVGSESSRLTPAVCSPQHQRVRVRHPFYPGNRDEKLTPPPAATQRPTPSTRRSTPKEAGAIPGVSRSEVNAGRNGPVLPSPSPATSPQHWGSSITSEFEPESCATHSESEGEGHSVLSAFARPANKQHYQQHSPSPSAAHPNGNLRRAQSSGLLLPNRHEAIQALHEEVSRLRQRLEGSLRRSSGNTPAPSMAPPAARGEPLPRPRRSSTPVLRSQEEGGRKEDEDGGEEVVQEDREPLRPTPRRRSASVPRLRSTLDITSDSDRVQSLPRPQSSRPVPASFAAQRSRKRAGEHIQEAVTFRGPYTGRQYSVLVPGDSEDPEPRERERDGRSERERASSACPHCCPAHHHGNYYCF
ncbi:AKNA factor, partial [Amia calva]|nr:AKNA factor [Amia calva]